MNNKSLILLTLIISIIISILTFPICYGEYYADIELEIKEEGYTEINGVTNHELLKSSDNFVSKNKGYWILNITTNESFEEYIYKLILPKGAVLNYIKTPEILSVESLNEKLIITGKGTNQSFRLVTQYKIERENNSTQTMYVYLILGLTILFIGYRFYLYNTKNKNRNNTNIGSNIQDIDLDMLSQRQREIIEVIKKHKKPINQTIIEKELQIPKSSVSRNIDSLVKRQILEKQSIGMSNLIKIKNNKKID